MGLGTRQSSFSTYLNIFGGQIVREWREEPKESDIPAGKELQTRKLSMGKNQGKTVWFVAFDYVAGMLGDVELDTSGDYGSRLKITIKDVDESYILTLAINSSAAQSFLFKMKNIDLSQEVSFEPWSMDAAAWKKLTGKDTDKGKSGMTIRQGDEKIENFFTRDEPNGLPELVIKKVGKETKVNDDDRMIFLYERLDEFIGEVKKNQGGSSDAPSGRATSAPDPSDSQGEEDHDDLPF